MFHDEQHKADLESRNAILQFDLVRELVRDFAGSLRLTAGLFCELQRAAIQDIYRCAGMFRDGDVYIKGTPHQPPSAGKVPQLVDEMCDYANSTKEGPIHTAAYLMWRCNWVHPFFGGNGRTSRAVSYLALCTGFNMDLPGTVTVPDMIVRARQPYYAALDAADAAWSAGSIDVTEMEKLLSDLLTRQLQSAI